MTMVTSAHAETTEATEMKEVTPVSSALPEPTIASGSKYTEPKTYKGKKAENVSSNLMGIPSKIESILSQFINIITRMLLYAIYLPTS
ncbi:hypothetical protein D5273_11810 [Enterorhabdus caecimuris]|nr:hypothetical protein [Adlercreutzia caecimuris]